MNNTLQLAERYLKRRGSLEYTHSSACFENIIDYVNHTLNFNVYSSKTWVVTSITVHQSADDWVCLNKEGNVVSCEDVVEEIVVNCDLDLPVFQFVKTVPNVNKLLLNVA